MGIPSSTVENLRNRVSELEAENAQLQSRLSCGGLSERSSQILPGERALTKVISLLKVYQDHPHIDRSDGEALLDDLINEVEALRDGLCHEDLPNIFDAGDQPASSDSESVRV